MKIFENRKWRGAISIFLVIITIPTMLFSAVLIDGSRMASAKAMTQEAADLAAASALAAYNQPLKDQFGLFAIEDNEKVEQIYKESLNATLLAYGMAEDEAYSERLWEIMKTSLSGQKSYMGESFLNLYDFTVEQCDIEKKFSLAEQNVLENQIVEYAKFRGLYVMTDRMDIFSNLGNIKENAEDNKVASEVMQDKMNADEANAAADRALASLRQEMEQLNKDVENVEKEQKNYLRTLRGKMIQIRYENIDTDEDLSMVDSGAAKDYENSKKRFKNSVTIACKQAGKVLQQAQQAREEVEAAIKRLEQFKLENERRAEDNEIAQELLQDAGNNIEAYKADYLPGIQKLLEDPELKTMCSDTGIITKLDRTMEKIHTAITAYIETIDELREEMAESDEADDSEADADNDEDEITEYYYFFLDGSGNTKDEDWAIEGERDSPRYYKSAVSEPCAYFINKKWDPKQVMPAPKYTDAPTGAVKQSDPETQSGKTGSADTNLEGEAERGAVEDSVYDTKPSGRAGSSESIKENNTEFYNKNSDLSASKNILEQGKNSILIDVGEVARDDVLGMTYMFGTFKTRLTGVRKFSSKGLSESDKKSFYMPKWRYGHPDGELDMRFSPKKDRETVLRSEIEYLVYGNQSDKSNEDAVYATIFAERLANNLIAMYSDSSGINLNCHAAASIASLATSGVVPETVFFWIFLTACATAETIIEMDYLISGGYRIPLFKTKTNLLLNKVAQDDKMISGYGENGIFVSYEDYLLIFLLVKGREKRIMRTADLIEMNMKKAGDAAFSMEQAFTYLRADTRLSIRYMFGDVMPFQTDYKKNGYRGRMDFTNTIYMGY